MLKIIQNSQIGMSRLLDSSTTTRMAKIHGPVSKTQSFLFEQNLYCHPLAGPSWERQFKKIQLQHGREKVPNWECLFVHREKGLCSSVYVDDITLVGEKQNIDPMWKVLNKEVDWENQHLSSIMYTWNALEDIVK